ncbi:photoreceptor cilium actin regulator [Pelodiscus sinensis]|uniref:photoreceptor cilium actin regulator n=1 Tax=Pelodiscus sinensis TaxID=13735 RepID=UPI003F6B2482
MGCTPSHSEIVNHVTKNGTNLLNKSNGILPVDPGDEEFSIPLLVKGSSCYDIDKFPWSGSLGTDHQLEKEEKTLELIKNVNFYLSSEELSLSESHEEEKKTERTATEAERAMSELIESQKHITEDIQIKKQSCYESEATAFTWDDESNAKQTPKKGKRQKSHKLMKQGRHCKSKEKSTAPPICKTEKKVDFPDLLVKAHQNAYAYLNPNLSKYETILCMANQATQTQLLLQQMVSFLVFRFDEINQLLEEIASDGEELLKEVGGNLAWPAGKGDPKEQPDLLQQLLQYTVNKMQLLNGTVASLTSSALQETWSYLQSAANNLEEKWKAKQGFDERLLKAIKLLEASAVVSSQAHADDRTLYSEDSGIGADNESLKEFNSLDKVGRQTCCDSCACDHPSQKHTRVPGAYPCSGTLLSVTTRSHDCALERHFKDIFYPSVHSKGTTSLPGETPENVSNKLPGSNVTKHPSFNSLQSDAVQEGEDFKGCESIDSPSANEESTQEEDDNISLSEMGKEALPRRPMSSPTITEKTKRPATKRIENPENAEMILKMKDAISEKIKFVPAKCGQKEWTEDEDGKAALAARPSTASGSQKTLVKQRRSRSEESLRSRAEDPTLLELQRTQKDLNKRLETFYMLNGDKETDSKQEILKSRAAACLPDTEHVTPRSSTAKLKASLSKNFNILPNQDKAPLHKSEQHTVSQPDERRSRKPLKATAFAQELSYRKENEHPEREKLNSGGCAPRKSVKKLIETFSPSSGLVKPTNLRTLGPVKCIRKFGLPVIPPTIPLQRALAPLTHKHRVSPIGDINPPDTNASPCNFPTAFPHVAELNKSDISEETDEDLENLPPPPPEMLMDSYFYLSECDENTIMEGNSSDVAKTPAKTEFHATKRMHTSPKIKASLHSIDLLSRKNINSPNVSVGKVLRNTGVDSKFRKYSLELNPTNVFIHSQEGKLASQRDYEMKEAADLYKQSHKIIPLQNPSGISKQNRNFSESEDSGTNLTSVQNQKQISPDSHRKNDKSPAFGKRISPTRTPSCSPPTEKRLSSPSAYPRHSLQAFNHMQPSFPPLQRQPSPPAHPRSSSPPMQKKLPSPPTHRKMPSPPGGHKQSPPAQGKLSSLPAQCREASPPPFCTTPSPPASPSRLHKVLQNSLDSGDEQQPPPSKIASNARSIFCPATSSLFEAKPPSPPSSFATEIPAGQPEVSASSQKTSALLRPCGDQQRRMAMSAANPQPFIKRSFSDRRPAVYLRLPMPVSASSEPLLNQASMECPRKEWDSWNSTCSSAFKGSGRSASHPELYIVGQGLHRE